MILMISYIKPVLLGIYLILLVLALMLGIYSFITNVRQDRELLQHINKSTQELNANYNEYMLLEKRLEKLEHKLLNMELEQMDISRANKNMRNGK